MSKKNWWEGLNDVWSDKRVTYLPSGGDIEVTHADYYMGDYVFHRFFGQDEDDVKMVRTVLVEVQKWNEWLDWLQTNTVGNSLLPLYVVPLEIAIMSHRSFTVVKWVDEYRPFDILYYR
jgi:hypothetical protein